MTVQIIVNMSHQEHVEIEEICINKAMSISEYFSQLHKLNMQTAFNLPEKCCKEIESACAKSGVMEFHEEFESLAKEPETKPVPVTTVQNEGLPDLRKKKKK